MPSHIDRQLRQRIGKWERRRQLDEQTKALGQGQQPMITISRAAGVAGRVVAEAVAEGLGFDIYDRSLIDKIAESANVRKQVVESVGVSMLEHITAWIGNQIEGGYFSSNDYVQHLSKVVLALGQHGQAIIIGRGAQFILQPENTLRVRVIAPLAHRVASVAAQQQLTEREARSEVQRVDADRAAYCRWHFNQDVASAEHYDMVLNVAHMPLKQCAKFVTELYTSRFGPHQGKKS